MTEYDRRRSGEVSSRSEDGWTPSSAPWPGKRTLAQSLTSPRRPPSGGLADAGAPVAGAPDAVQEPVDVDKLPEPIGIDKTPDPPPAQGGKDAKATQDSKATKPEPITDKIPDPIDIDKIPDEEPEGPQFSPDLPVPGPAPAPKLPPGQGPGSGIDWGQIWKDNKTNAIRSGLELSRLIPGLGLYTGMAADYMEYKQNVDSLDAVKGTPAGDRFREAMLAREVFVGVSNVIGHVRYLLETAQDVTTGTVVGAPVSAITVPANEALVAIGLGVKSGQTVMDIGIAILAEQAAIQNVDNPEAFKAYHALEQTFVVNTATDGISILLDIADLASGGFANAAVIKQAKGAINALKFPVSVFKVSLLPVINSWISIWGAQFWGYAEHGLPRKEQPADGAAAANVVEASGARSVGDQVGPNGVKRSVAGAIMLSEIDQIEQAYRIGAFLVEDAAATPQRMATQVSQAITQVTGMKDPFVWLRDRLASGIKEQSAQMSHLLQVQSMAGQAQTAATATSSAMDTAIQALDKVVMPTIAEPAATDLGDGAIAGAAGKLIDGARGLGASAVRSVRNRLQASIDSAKGPARQKAADIKADMDWTVEFLGELQKRVNQQTGEIGQLGGQFAAKLGQCRNVDDIFNLMFGLGATVMGAEEFTVDDLRRNWQEIRGAIDRGFVVAREVAQGGGGPSAPPASPGADAGPGPAPAEPGQSQPST